MYCFYLGFPAAINSSGSSMTNTTPAWFRGLPNQLTLFRIGTIPIMLFLFPLGVESIQIFCAGLFTVASFTDWLDGVVARRYQLESGLGRILDPIADKLLVTSGLVLLVGEGYIWSWLAGLLLCREMVLAGMRLVSLQQGFEMHVSKLAKFKTFFLDFSIGCLMVHGTLWGIPFLEFGMISVWIALLLSLYSAWEYGVVFFKKAAL